MHCLYIGNNCLPLSNPDNGQVHQFQMGPLQYFHAKMALLQWGSQYCIVSMETGAPLLQHVYNLKQHLKVTNTRL